VDKETSKVRVGHFVQAQGIGVAVNPMAVEGQIDGGMAADVPSKARMFAPVEA
jgi:CO/xanthine dehydrogenase Mo-binding subunit